MGEAFPTRLRAVREARGLAQWELAADAGTHQRHISDYERGKVRPYYGTVRKLAAALEVPVTALLEEEGE